MIFNPNTSDSETDTITAMTECMDAIRIWMLQFYLKMDDSKTDCIVFSSSQMMSKLKSFFTTIGADIIICTDDVKSLGVLSVYLDNHLRLERHITNTNAKSRAIVCIA